MIAMIFEYWIDPQHEDEYLQHARVLRQLVTEIDGFMGIERYTSTADPEKILALGFFRDDEAVREWRNLPLHRQAQALGRTMFFKSYRLRMAEVIRDYDIARREQAPQDSRRAYQE